MDGVTPDRNTEGVTPDRNTEGVTTDRNTEGVTTDRNTEGVTPDRNTEGVTPDRNTETTSFINNQNPRRSSNDESNQRNSRDDQTCSRSCIVETCKRYKCNIAMFFFCYSILVLVIIVSIIYIKGQNHQPPTHHASFHLKTNIYTESDEASYLQWVKDEGNFKLINGTYIFVPQDGVYLIKCAVQLYFPKNSTAETTVLLLESMNNGRPHVFLKRRPSFLNTTEDAIIQLSFRYKLKSNDEIFLKMNKARFVIPNGFSNYLSITSL